MQNVVLLIRKGPTSGSRIELELGRIDLGRDPGPSGVLLPGDSQVSRLHGELREQGGRVFYRNLSPNGTLLDRAPVREERELQPGAELRLGEEYLIEVQFRRERLSTPTAPQKGGVGDPLRSGLLARPAVRAGLAAYLLALVSLAIFLGLRGERTVVDEFAPARQSYLASYRPAGLASEERRERVGRADRLVSEILAADRSEDWDQARAACRELMALDGNPASPIYRFGARQLGALADRK